MGSGFDLTLLALVGCVAYRAYEVRRIRQITEAGELKEQILAMGHGRLWPTCPGARFEIITQTAFQQYRSKFFASLVMFTDDGFKIIIKTRTGSGDVLEALEGLLEELAVYVIEHEDEIKKAFDEAVSSKVRRAEGVDDVIPQRKVPYVDRLDGRVIMRCAAM
ncbi:hypothetical protein DPSP01_000080 [Paraphaeosphaeria sporulosa]|uniref:Uncharacterized protein n=1 Tax=Paraphaeosphaeria sporulosa TaxID=1460663 RepID=A0A177D0E7_9PLEO|nr:uncharacterized protein CC84DRAFT_1212468 [Paraphaeosphaeria sporulosa]OAG12996.1 hypothetical protein CC84DRAFT_1212468 [Paraphaeosphaeria sporulosa]